MYVHLGGHGTQAPALAGELAGPGLLRGVELGLAAEPHTGSTSRLPAVAGALVDPLPLILGKGRQESKEALADLGG
jgi:hypothetical protein